MTCIIDAHHHIWRQMDLPWLMGPMRPRIFGPYEPIQRDYRIEDYLQDIRGAGVEKSVYIQANWAPDQFEDEVAWVQSVADSHGWPHAIVGYADVTQTDVGRDLDMLRQYPLMRGVRQQFHWHEKPEFRFAPRADLAADPIVRRNIAKLADHDWCFELQVFTAQMTDAASLAAACPNVTFVLQHAGMLEDLSSEGRRAWKEGMQRLADQPNIVCKLSGLGTFIHRNDPGHIADLVTGATSIFTAERCLFGSNFPIEKLWTGYGPLVDAYRQATANMAESERQAIFAGTASQVYRL